MVKMANFDHMTTAILKFWPWSWSKIFDHLTITPGRGPIGQKIMVILPPKVKPVFPWLTTPEVGAVVNTELKVGTLPIVSLA